MKNDIMEGGRQMKHLRMKALAVVLVLIVALASLAGCGDKGNPCDTACAAHSASGDCHCHGHCGTSGCECHGAH